MRLLITIVKGNNHWESESEQNTRRCKTEQFIVHSCRNKRVICLNLFNSWVMAIITLHKRCSGKKIESQIPKKQHTINAQEYGHCDDTFFDIIEKCALSGPFPAKLFLPFSLLISIPLPCLVPSVCLPSMRSNEKMRFNSLEKKGNLFPFIWTSTTEWKTQKQ